jgi:hypothetical protein
MRLWYQTAAPYAILLYALLWALCLFGGLGGFR